MQDLLSNKKIILLIFVTAIIFVMMAFSSSDNDRISLGKRAVGIAITPVQSMFTKAIVSTSGFFGHFSDIGELRNENNELSLQIDKLENEIRTLTEFKVENEQLRTMLDLKQTGSEYDLLACSVIAKEPGNWFNVFTIDKGEMDGIKKNNVVITSKGLVGHITEVGGSWARVMTIIDPKSSVGATVPRTNRMAIVDGSADIDDDRLCKMTYISKDSNLITGDIVETSGLGGIYPQGVLIGKIREIKPEMKGMSQYAYIEPSVDFSKISQVFVILN